jgi:protein phosphatase 1 regulatory subunit 10
MATDGVQPTRKMTLRKKAATQKLQRVGHVSSLYRFAHVTDAISGVSFVLDTKTKKRKPSEPPPKPGPPAKKTAVTPTTVKITTTVTKAGAVKDAKSDSSFFSTPKPKPKLPSFKKAPVPVKKEPEMNIAQPSSLDPFQEALKSMAKGRKESPSVTPTPPQPTPPTPATMVTVSTGLTKTGKKKKSVSWAPDGRLEQIKLIERAVYDDDPVDVSIFLFASSLDSWCELSVYLLGAFVALQGTTVHNIRDLDRDEGAAMHAQLFEELIDWMEPQGERPQITCSVPVLIPQPFSP